MADVEIPSGLVAITTYGQITGATAECLMNARSLNEKRKVTAVAYKMFPGTLVDRARNDAVRQALAARAGWLLFIDGDMTFPEDAIFEILLAAYHTRPDADVIGAYCNLKGEPNMPTIDTGTGTWEEHYPGEGIVEVIRTGGAFTLIKMPVFGVLKPPWFSTRTPQRAIDYLAEVDNFARCKLSGVNPFRELPGTPWEKLERAAMDDKGAVQGIWHPSEIGEDSSFCDRVRASGFRIFVHTNIVTGHVEHRVIQWTDHREAMRKRDKDSLLMVGVGG